MQNVPTLGKNILFIQTEGLTVKTSLIHANTCNANPSGKKGLQGSDTQYHLTHGNLYIELRTEAVNVY